MPTLKKEQLDKIDKFLQTRNIGTGLDIEGFKSQFKSAYGESKFNTDFSGVENETYDYAFRIYKVKSSRTTPVSPSSGGDDSGGYQLPKPVSSITKVVSSALTAAETSYMPGIEAEKLTVSGALNSLFGESFGQLRNLEDIGKDIFQKAMDSIAVYVQQQSALQTQFNERLKMTGTLSEQFRASLTEANPRLLQLGIGFQDLTSAAEGLITSTGKFATLNKQTWENAGLAAKVYVGELEDLTGLFPSFMEIGLGAEETTKAVTRIGKESLSVGISSQKTIQVLKQDIGKINEYGFKNGVDGLGKMAKTAIELRMNLNDVFKIAEKVMNPEGAIDLAANLQVLGGAIGDFNDPLKLMYMATNNVEGLQDALKDAASSLTTYNAEQGRFEITGVNLRRAREMATQFGMSLGDLSKIAIATAERTSAASDLMARGLTLKDKDKEFLTNIAQMKEGRMVIELGASEKLQKALGVKDEVALEELTQEQVNQLVAMRSELETKTEEEIVRDQANTVKQMGRDLSYIVAMMRTTGGRGAEVLYQKVMKETGMEKYDIKELSGKLATKVSDDIKNYRFNADISKEFEDKYGKKTPTPTKDLYVPQKGPILQLPDGKIFEGLKEDSVMFGTRLDEVIKPTDINAKNKQENNPSLNEGYRRYLESKENTTKQAIEINVDLSPLNDIIKQISNMVRPENIVTSESKIISEKEAITKVESKVEPFTSEGNKISFEKLKLPEIDISKFESIIQSKIPEANAIEKKSEEVMKNVKGQFTFEFKSNSSVMDAFNRALLNNPDYARLLVDKLDYLSTEI